MYRPVSAGLVYISLNPTTVVCLCNKLWHLPASACLRPWSDLFCVLTLVMPVYGGSFGMATHGFLSDLSCVLTRIMPVYGGSPGMATHGCLSDLSCVLTPIMTISWGFLRMATHGCLSLPLCLRVPPPNHLPVFLSFSGHLT